MKQQQLMEQGGSRKYEHITCRHQALLLCLSWPWSRMSSGTTGLWRWATLSQLSNVIATFVYTYGIRGLQFSLTTAVGLFQSVINVIFLLTANALAKKFGERGIW